MTGTNEEDSKAWENFDKAAAIRSFDPADADVKDRTFLFREESEKYYYSKHLGRKVTVPED